MDYETFLKALEEAGMGFLKDANIRGKVAAQSIKDFVANLEPVAEQAFETATRTGEATHWNTLRIIASRILLKTMLEADTFSVGTQASIRSIMFAVIRTASVIALA